MLGEFPLISKDLDKIDERDLISLIENSVVEWRTIEYKESLTVTTDNEKKEFLADISSFANASGGDLIYGISQNENGTPKELVGMEIANIDHEILKLESMIRDGIEPRLPSVRFASVGIADSRTVVIIRVGKSWASPHRVSYKSSDKFFSRGSNGKYRMDVAELRTAFALSETLNERIREFRVDRLSKINSGETPVPFYDNAKIVLHLVPLTSFDPAKNYKINLAASSLNIPPMYCSGWNYRYNFDGFLTYCAGRDAKSHSYVQLFRNGIMECVEGLLLKPSDGDLVIPSIAYEDELSKSLHAYLLLLSTLNVELPLLLFLSLLGVRGYAMSIGRHGVFSAGVSTTIDRDVLLLPEILVESYDVDEHSILKPCFDSVWNACGLLRSLNYDDAGNWSPK